MIMAITGIMDHLKNYIDDNLENIQPMTSEEANTGTGETSRTISAKLLNDIIDGKIANLDIDPSQFNQVQIKTGSANGTISVDGTDVRVKGLDSAAYTKSSRYASAEHNHTSENITSLTGYVTATEESAIEATDSLNIALGKIQKALDGKQIAGSYLSSDGTVENAAKLGGVAAANYAKLSSPALIGTPTAPTADTGTNNTQIATTAFVQNAVSGLVNNAPATLDTLNELATALGNDPNFATTISNQIGSKVNATSADYIKSVTSDNDGSSITFTKGDDTTVVFDNFFTRNTDQNITGIKTFLGAKRLKFKQNNASDKLGFTLYSATNDEIGYLEYNPDNTTEGITGLMALGNYAKNAASIKQIGFRRYSGETGAGGAFNLLVPLVADAKTPFNLTTTYSNFYIPLGVTNGSTIVRTSKSGVLDISSLMPTDATLTGTVTLYAGTTIPTNWLHCDGQSLSRETYANLFAVIGTTYGNDDDNTFKVPDLTSAETALNLKYIIRI